MSAGSIQCSVSMRIASASEATPTGLGKGRAMRGCGLNPCEYRTGKPARAHARRKRRTVSRCEMNRKSPSIRTVSINRNRSSCTFAADFSGTACSRCVPRVGSVDPFPFVHEGVCIPTNSCSRARRVVTPVKWDLRATSSSSRFEGNSSPAHPYRTPRRVGPPVVPGVVSLHESTS